MVRTFRLFVEGPFGQTHMRLVESTQSVLRPLVCLHMFPLSGESFSELLPMLAKQRTVIAPDFPGYGESDAPAYPVDAEEYAASIWDALSKLDLTGADRKFDLFGIHAGAKLAVEMAFQQPRRVGRLALCSAAVLKKAEIDDYKATLGKIPLDSSGTRFQTLWTMQRDYAGSTVPLELVASTFTEVLRAGERYHWGHNAVFAYNDRFTSRLEQVEHPTLLINPGDDLYDKTKRTAKLLRNGRMIDRREWEPGFLHVNAAQLADDLNAFLSEELATENHL